MAMARKKQWNEVTVRIDIGDITDMEVEAFLYYAREDLKLDSGFGGAIAGRGGIEIRKELEQIGTLAPPRRKGSGGSHCRPWERGITASRRRTARASC